MKGGHSLDSLTKSNLLQKMFGCHGLLVSQSANNFLLQELVFGELAIWFEAHKLIGKIKWEHVHWQKSGHVPFSN
jgi:hypothetical protein